MATALKPSYSGLEKQIAKVIKQDTGYEPEDCVYQFLSRYNIWVAKFCKGVRFSWVNTNRAAQGLELRAKLCGRFWCEAVERRSV